MVRVGLSFLECFLTFPLPLCGFGRLLLYRPFGLVLVLNHIGRVWLPALGPAWPTREESVLFGCLHLPCVPHGTNLKAHLAVARWKRSDRQFLASQAEASAQGGPLARGEMGGIRAGMHPVSAYLLLTLVIFSYL